MEYPVLDMKATGARIKEIRKANHIKVAEIARYMGFESEQSVYKWQRGETLPTVDNLYALSKLFGTTMENILRVSNEKDESPSFHLYRKIELLVNVFVIYSVYNDVQEYSFVEV